MTITWFDALLFGIMFISAVLALMRGFTRELLSLLSWVGGAIAAWLLHPVLQNTARSYFPPEDRLIADIVLAIVIFLVVLIIIAILTMRLSDWILESGVGVLDRTLGFIFGLARGLLLVVVAYLFFIWMATKEQHPQGLRNAQSLDLVESTAEVIIQYMPTELAETLLSRTYKHGDEGGGTDAPLEEEPAESDDDTDDNAALTGESEDGYDGSARSGLDQLLQSTQDNQN